MRLYENLGFATVRTSAAWSRSLSPLGTDAAQ
jgi:beta-glucosidase/6-phospho-beta-glucosidase/beta-galactosidase